MEIATTTFEDDAFHHAGGRIRHFAEETSELPALTPDSTYAIRIGDRRRTFQRVTATVLGVLALSAIIGLALGPSLRAEASVPLTHRTARTAIDERTSLLDAKRSLASASPAVPARQLRTARGRSK
jgi:hypothetical protein